MSTTLFFLVPIGMLVVVWSVCFVGCTWPNITYDDPGPSSVGPPYSTLILEGKEGLVAYWPLNDAKGTPVQLQGSLQGSTGIGAAADPGPGPKGTYILPPNYPSPPVAQSVPIPGLPGLNLQQGSIVPGDQGSPDLIGTPASVDFEGGYVSIPWSAQDPQLPQFTLEAWIKPNWTVTGILWVVFSALINNTGFRVLINDKNQLAVVIGNGTANNMEYALSSAIDLTTMTYIAVTCDLSGNVTLFASGVSDTPVPVQTQTFPSTGYVPVVPTPEVTYFIGAGENDQPLRTPTANPNGAPEFPFQGQIQSVALYNSAGVDIKSHFSSGAGG
jgi:hypothetical protein